MNRFGYGRDRMFLAAVAGYVLNQGLLKPRCSSPFLHGYFNDLLLIPAALPVVLWAHRRLRLRLHDLPPSWREVSLHLVVWTVICEILGPPLMHRGTADFRDFLAYSAGGLVAWFWWNRPALEFPSTIS